MIEFICTPSDERIRTFFFEKASAGISQGKKSYLLVPEQQVLAYEDEVGRRLSSNAPLLFTVTSFSLLSNIAQRRFGALSYKALKKPQKMLFIWKAIKESAGFLSLYNNTSAESLAPRMLECIDELKMCGVSESELSDAAIYMSDSPMFAKKLTDIDTVYSAYSALVGNKYSDINDEQKKLLGFLSSNDMFSGYDIYVDSFTDFTPLQLAVIGHMINHADNITFALPTDPTTDTSIHFECIRKTYSDLTAICEKHGKEYKLTVLDSTYNSSPLSFYKSNLISSTAKSSLSDAENSSHERVEAYPCLDTHEEICACINLIKRALCEGCKLSDIAVISRDPGKYERLLALSAAEAGIPLFTSDKRLVSDSCFAVFIISLLKMISGGWRREDITAHLRSGISNIPFDDISRFDLYTTRWNIDGRAQFLGKDFTSPYREFRKDSTTPDAFVTSTNKIKNELFPKIKALEEKLSHSASLKEMLISLFEYIDASNAANSLRQLADAASKRGDVRTAEQLSRTYSIVIKLFDDIAYALSDEPQMSIKDFASMIELVFSSAEIGSIPTRKDEVIFADASMYRSFGHKVVILLGMSDGDFPRHVTQSGLITDAEKSILLEEGLSLSPSNILSASKEYLFLWRSVSMAKQQLYMTFPQRTASDGEKKPSIAITAMIKLLGKDHVKSFASSVHDLLYDPNTVFSGLSSLGKDNEYKCLADDYCRTAKDSSPRLGGMRATLSPEHTLSASIAQQLFRYPLVISPTALEKYNECAFRYFCSSILSLDDGSKNEFTGLNSGTLVHRVLESFLKGSSDLSQSETYELCRAIADDYYNETCPPHLSDSERLRMKFTRAAINASLLAGYVSSELRSSGFSPKAVETNVSYDIVNDNEKKITLTGRADRVDSAHEPSGEFLRVIDYKTGAKQFTLDDMTAGIALQLPLYLSAITKNNDQSPGGFMYLSSAVSAHKIESAKELSDEEKIDTALASSIEASGVLDSLFLKKTKKKLTSLVREEIQSILNEADAVAVSTTDSMRSGNISASPHISEEKSACEYCPYFPVCRSKKQASDNKK